MAGRDLGGFRDSYSGEQCSARVWEGLWDWNGWGSCDAYAVGVSRTHKWLEYSVLVKFVFSLHGQLNGLHPTHSGLATLSPIRTIFQFKS